MIVCLTDRELAHLMMSFDCCPKLEFWNIFKHFKKVIQNEFLITNYWSSIACTRGSKNVKELFMWWFKSENINDSLHQMIIIVLKEFRNNELIRLQNLIQGLVNSFFLILDCMIKNDIKPCLTNIELCDWFIFDDLHD